MCVYPYFRDVRCEQHYDLNPSYHGTHIIHSGTIHVVQFRLQGRDEEGKNQLLILDP